MKILDLPIGLITKAEFTNTGRNHESFFCYLCNNDQDSVLIDTTIDDTEGNLILICKKCVDKMWLLLS